MRQLSAVTAAITLLCLGAIAQAKTAIKTVRVGDPGNAADTRYASPGYGSVDYVYRMGKYEVTALQYTDFLNHKAKSDPYGLYNTAMADPVGWKGCNIQRSGSPGHYSYTIGNGRTDVALWGDRPVNFVSYWDACRFANWLGNGQGDGDTETGAYTLNGYNGPDGREIARNPGAEWVIPTEDEWYKAAYYKGGGKDAGYWDYATQSDEIPGNQVLNPDPGNSANYYTVTYCIGAPYYRTNVGEFENSASAYGTFDQNGNVWEFNEAIDIYGGVWRGGRGGSLEWTAYTLPASFRYGWVGVTYEGYASGFRVCRVTSHGHGRRSDPPRGAK